MLDVDCGYLCPFEGARGVPAKVKVSGTYSSTGNWRRCDCQSEEALTGLLKSVSLDATVTLQKLFVYSRHLVAMQSFGLLFV